MDTVSGLIGELSGELDGSGVVDLGGDLGLGDVLLGDLDGELALAGLQNEDSASLSVSYLLLCVSVFFPLCLSVSLFQTHSLSIIAVVVDVELRLNIGDLVSVSAELELSVHVGLSLS